MGSKETKTWDHGCQQRMGHGATFAPFRPVLFVSQHNIRAVALDVALGLSVDFGILQLLCRPTAVAESASTVAQAREALRRAGTWIEAFDGGT